jgi:hypothetical protein
MNRPRETITRVQIRRDVEDGFDIGADPFLVSAN